MPSQRTKGCVRCVLTSAIPGVYIDSDNVCNFCLTEQARPTRQDRESARHIWARRLKDGKPVVVAFSGGADSAACLIYLSREIGVRCVCVLVDNGFIPDKVKRRARDLCDQLNAEFQIKSFSLIDVLPRDFGDPCRICIPRVLAYVYDAAYHCKSSTVATGHLYGPAVHMISGQRGNLVRVAPLFCDGVGEIARDQLLASVNWDNAIAYGPSSNCRLLGYVEYRYHRNFGYSPAVAELSHEIRAGMISRERALAFLEKGVTYLPEYDEIERIIGHIQETSV